MPARPGRARVGGAAASAVAIVVATAAGLEFQSRPEVDRERLPYAPRQAVVYRTPKPLTIDGRLDEPAWRETAWSDPFIDIQGEAKPRFLTRVKMLWDAEFYYFAAEMEEPDISATLTERDSVIFHDNDFEVFIDPDGDTHVYYELEVNALNTSWDLMLVKPYRDGGPAIDAWDIAGLRTAVDVRGTINRPGDRDEGWTVELALPWSVLSEAAPGGKAPQSGDQWRVNFSRVEWQFEVRDGTYVKRLDPATSKPFPEDNWVWSPQGAINMHMPERWGIVQFSDAFVGAGTTRFVEDRNDRVKWALRRLYYRQQQYREKHGKYASDLASLQADDVQVEGIEFRPALKVTDSLYEIGAAGFDGSTVHIRHDGLIWRTKD
jgi:hypothetical protein